MEKTLIKLVFCFYILLIGIMLGYKWRMHHDSYTGISPSKTPVLSVKEFIASQPDIAIDLTLNTPVITDYVNRYNK